MATADAAASRPGLGGLVAAVRRIVAEPTAMPSVQSRVDAILRQVPAGTRRVVLYVPGTSEHEVLPRLRAAFDSAFGADGWLRIEYEASWRFADSVPDGTAVLGAVLEQLSGRRPPPQVLVGGESQGAWVIASVLADPRLATVVTRAALWGAPAAAPIDFGDGHDPRVHEYANHGDVVTMDFGREANAKLVGAIDRFARRRLVAGLLPLLGYAVTHPRVLVALCASQRWRLPIIGTRYSSPHDYDIVAGVRFLATGEPDAGSLTTGSAAPGTSAVPGDAGGSPARGRAGRRWRLQRGRRR